MLQMLQSNKVKLIAIVILILLGWLTYLAFNEYAIESRNCLSQGGKLVYDTDSKTLYCDLPKPEKSWWPW